MNEMLPPAVAAHLRRVTDQGTRLESQLRALMRAYKALANEHQDSVLELKRLRDWVQKAAQRIKYIEDIPGKRVPYFMNFEIQIPGPDTATNSVRNQRLTTSRNVSMDGPFVGTMYLAAFRMQTFSLGPSGNRPNDPAAGVEVITPLTGRFRPIASTCDAFRGAYIGFGLGGQVIESDPAGGTPGLAGAKDIQTFRPGTIDFLWEISDGGSDRQRQNDIATPSRYLFSECERPFYLAVSDFFERGSVISVAVTPTRDPGFVEVNYPTLTGGFAEGDLDPIDPNNANSGRLVLSVGGTITFTVAGYKILQSMSPAV